LKKKGAKLKGRGEKTVFQVGTHLTFVRKDGRSEKCGPREVVATLLSTGRKRRRGGGRPFKLEEKRRRDVLGEP